MTTTVYLIRHGETDWNVEGRWQGHTDVPLNKKGLTQARMLAKRLQNEGVAFHAIYSSDLVRAYQTAWEVGAAVQVPVELLPALREIDLGNWSGLTREEVKERYPIEFALLSTGEDIPRGGGETLAAVRKRVVDVVDAMVKHHPDRTLAFVTHGGPVRIFTHYVCDQHDTSATPCPHIGNTSLSLFRYTKGRWQLVRCNDMQHLEGLPQAPDLMSLAPDDTELLYADSDWPADPLP